MPGFERHVAAITLWSFPTNLKLMVIMMLMMMIVITIIMMMMMMMMMMTATMMTMSDLPSLSKDSIME